MNDRTVARVYSVQGEGWSTVGFGVGHVLDEDEQETGEVVDFVGEQRYLLAIAEAIASANAVDDLPQVALDSHQIIGARR